MDQNAKPSPARSPMGLGNPAADHLRSLKNFFELPFRVDLSMPVRSAIDGLYQRAYRGGDLDWKAVYEEALSLCWQVAGDLDARGAELQQQATLAAERAEREARSNQGAQAAGEEARRALKKATERVGREWTERVRRQYEHTQYEATAAAVSTMESEGIVHDPPPGGAPMTEQAVTISVRPDWWQRYVEYVAESCQRWTQSTVAGLETDFAAAITAALAGSATYAQRPYAPLPPPPDTEVLLGGRPPPHQKIDVPGVLGTAYTKARSLAFMVLGGITLLGRAGLATDKKTLNLSEEGLGYLRMVSGAIFIIFNFIALTQAIDLQRKEREKGDKAQCQAMEGYVRAELQRSLERHRGKLERYVLQSVELWDQSIDRYIGSVVLPRLDSDGDTRAEAQRRAKASAAALSEELSKVRSQRSALQSTMVEVQTRIRELSLA